MSTISGQITPELRATLEAVFSKWAAPGMCNPDDDTACIKGRPSQQQVQGDHRTRDNASMTPCWRWAATPCPRVNWAAITACRSPSPSYDECTNGSGGGSPSEGWRPRTKTSGLDLDADSACLRCSVVAQSDGG